MHPLCGEFFEKIRKIADTPPLQQLFVDRQQAAKKKGQLVPLKSISQSLKNRGKQIDRLNAQIKDIDRQLNSNPLVMDFWALTLPDDATLRDTLVSDLNRFERIYVFKKLMWQMLFLLPLLALFGIWHIKSVHKARAIQRLISAHLIVVASIPIVLKILEVVLELVPYHFFKDLFDLLKRLHIIALWYYGVIIAAIAGALLCVYIIQKKIFNKKRLYEKRLMKGACFSCGKKLPENKATACPFCGTKQLEKCDECGADTYINSDFCVNCGQAQHTLDF